ncbi:MAG: DMT family transporter [Rhodospirillaceae bacterium]|nr:DMT family transporter [Rhodospirillaceae bacterium]
MRVIALTALAILAFAGNSLLTRWALAPLPDGVPAIGAAEFVTLRLVAGALMLALLALRQRADVLPRRADLGGVLSLLAYGEAFTFAYLTLGAATGALILFATVQLTLALWATLRGTPLSGRDRLGLVIAFAGMAWLLAPGATAPPLVAALLMVLAGIAWGIYTMLGKGAADPFARTARNFIGAAPLALLLLPFAQLTVPTFHGAALAIASGAVTSGLGYVVWYAVLPRLKVATAGAAQLLVPVVAATGGILWLGESLSLKLAAVTVLVLGGIWLTIHAPKPR